MKHRQATRKEACAEAARLCCEIKQAPTGGIWRWEGVRFSVKWVPLHSYTDAGTLVVEERTPGHGRHGK